MNLSIQSPGLLDPKALILMGVSSKREEEGKIGRFGTGLKYALAYLLRNNHPVRLFVGKEEIPIETRPVTFRDSTYDQIFIAGEATSITTQMGPDWELWQAIRELYCNALDEGETEPCRGKEPKEGFTTFLIGNCEGVVRTFAEYFPLKAEVLADTPHGQIIDARSGTVYKQRVQVGRSGSYSFAYNLDSVKLNEERALKEPGLAQIQIVKVLLTCNSPTIIRSCIGAVEWGMVNQYNTYSFPVELFSPAWLTYLESIVWGTAEDAQILKARPHNFVQVSDGLALLLKTHNLGTPAFRKVKIETEERLETTDWQFAMIGEALRCMNLVGYSVTYPILVWRFSDPSIFGMVDETQIKLAEITFDRGQQFVLSTILEEYIHLKYRVANYTREFQDIVLELLAQRLMSK